MILMTPKLSPIKTQFLSPMECEGEEKTLFKFIWKKKILFLVIRGYSINSGYITYILHMCSRDLKFETTQTLGNMFANAFGLLCHIFLPVCISAIRSVPQDKYLSLISIGTKYRTIFRKRVMRCSQVWIKQITVCSSAYKWHNSLSPAMCFLRHSVLEFNW